MKTQENYDNKNYVIWDGSYKRDEKEATKRNIKRYKRHSDKDYDINWWCFVFLAFCYALIISCADFVCSRIWSCM